MILRVLFTIWLLHFSVVWARHEHPMEKYHNPSMFTTTMNPIVDMGTDTVRMHTRHTPDFRLEEPLLEPWPGGYIEQNRPYRASPHRKLVIQGQYSGYDHAELFGCYCTTVYKRLRVLAGCAVLTRKHILTTASSTWLVLRKHRKARTLENILGAWYDTDLPTFNSSMYMTPARIHFHPLFTKPTNVNRSHPFPVMWDMSIWASTYYFHKDTVLCSRGGPHKWDLLPSTPSPNAYYHIFGYQFMRAYGRRPMPWFKYTVRQMPEDAVIPCPKTEWGWFHCFKTGSWAPLGLDQGAALHRRTFRRYYRYDGLLGLNVMSIKLRLLHFSVVWARHEHPMEKYHNPSMFTTTMNPIVDMGTDTVRMHTRHTPDFRLEEPLLEPWPGGYIEQHRPYRASPHRKLVIEGQYSGYDHAELFGCYCTTVYKRLRVLAGCAVLTRKHILTTASSTWLVLRKHRKARTLENILGAWYDTELPTYNSSMYMTPARIHFHPLFTKPTSVNRSHPFPVMWDMSIWASTYYFHKETVLCSRGGPHKWDLLPSTPAPNAYYHIFGYQFMRAYGRRPMPWFKYTVRTMPEDAVVPCPKTEWGWFHCFKTGSWAPLGLDQGAALHRRTFRSWSNWRYDGLLGLNVISLKLRSVQMLSYFNDVNTHKALDFFYTAYNGKLQCVYLDGRFEDSFNKAPVPLEPIKEVYIEGEELYRSVSCCLSQKYRTGYD